MKIQRVIISLFIGLLFFQFCEKNPFDSPQPGRLVLNLKLDESSYQQYVRENDMLKIVVQYVKGYVDSSKWAYVIDKDSLKVLNLLNVDDNHNVLSESIIDTVWIDSLNFQLDTLATQKPVILCDNEGVYLPPSNYLFLKVKAVLEDTTIILNGKRSRIKQKPNTETIVNVDLNENIEENSIVEKNFYFDLKNSIEKSVNEIDLYYFYPQFYIE